MLGKIIDFEKKGNTIKFYLGEKTDDWGWTNKDYKDSKGNTPDWLKPSDTYYGDDWDDMPYECNAGSIYDEFVKGIRVCYFDFNDVILEPCDGSDINSSYCKEDMVARKVPCIIRIPKDYLKKNNLEAWQVDSFEYALEIDEAEKFYFGDTLLSGESIDTEKFGFNGELD